MPSIVDVLERDAQRRLHGAVEAQQLLDRGGQEPRLGAETAPLFGLAEQGEHAVADQVRRGLVAGEQQQVAGREQLGVAQRVALLLRLDHRADQVVARRAAAIRDGVGEVAEEAAGRPRWRRARASALGDADARDQRARPLAELAVVADRDAEQLGDHDRGQRLGEVVDQVEAAAFARPRRAASPTIVSM